MKLRWTPHIFAVMAFVVLIVMGACVTLTPEEYAAQRAAYAEQMAEQMRANGRGQLRINNTSQSDSFYKLYDMDLKETSTGGGILRGGQGSPGFSVKGDSSYIVRYRQARANEDTATVVTKEDTTYWNSRTIYVPIGETVTVNIP